jgi:hypothetical protein
VISGTDYFGPAEESLNDATISAKAAEHIVADQAVLELATAQVQALLALVQAVENLTQTLDAKLR